MEDSMKQLKGHWILFIMFLSALIPAGAEVHFSGELIPEVNLNIPQDGDYDSPLNPENSLAVKDVMFRNEINLKLDESSDTGALNLWIQLGQYPVADMLRGSAAILSEGNPVLTAAVADMASASQAYIYTAEIIRANAAWIPGKNSRLTVGRQSYLTGYGYGWNPVDLANPPKNPTDPSAYVRGVDGLTLQYNPQSWLGIKTYGLLPSEGPGWDYDELLAGMELTLQASALEIQLSGLYGGAEQGDDPYDFYPHAGAAAVFMDIQGVGVYGEGVVRSRSRRNSPDMETGASVLKEKAVYSALLGGEYYFSSGLAAVAEYFYNGEGWDQNQREDYASLPSDLSLYSPLYFARHYALLNLMIPWYARDSSFNLNMIYSPDSQALFVTPSASFNLNYEGTLVSEIGYTGMTSLDDGRKNEAWLSPVKHSIVFNLRYYF